MTSINIATKYRIVIMSGAEITRLLRQCHVRRWALLSNLLLLAKLAVGTSAKKADER